MEMAVDNYPAGRKLSLFIPFTNGQCDFAERFVSGHAGLVLVQVLVFLALRTCFTGLSRFIAEDKVTSGILLGVLSLTAGILNAACMTD